jgi:hypothetical protein
MKISISLNVQDWKDLPNEIRDRLIKLGSIKLIESSEPKFESDVRCPVYVNINHHNDTSQHNLMNEQQYDPEQQYDTGKQYDPEQQYNSGKQYDPEQQYDTSKLESSKSNTNQHNLTEYNPYYSYYPSSSLYEYDPSPSPHRSLQQYDSTQNYTKCNYIDKSLKTSRVYKNNNRWVVSLYYIKKRGIDIFNFSRINGSLVIRNKWPLTSYFKCNVDEIPNLICHDVGEYPSERHKDRLSIVDIHGKIMSIPQIMKIVNLRR